MYKQTTVVHYDIVLNSACGNTLPYSNTVLVTSYTLSEGESINCIFPANKPFNYITPCKVTFNHQAMGQHNHHSNYSYQIASIYSNVLCYGKGNN